jgi:hypothetical protein
VIVCIRFCCGCRRRRKRGEKFHAFKSSLLLTKLENFENEWRNNKSANGATASPACCKAARLAAGATTDDENGASDEKVMSSPSNDDGVENDSEADTLKRTDRLVLDFDSMSAEDIYLALLKRGGDYYAAESPSPESPGMEHRLSIDRTMTDPLSDVEVNDRLMFPDDAERSTAIAATQSASDDDHALPVNCGWRPRASIPKLSAHEDSLLTGVRSGTLPASASSKSKTKYNPVLLTSTHHLPSSSPSSRQSGSTSCYGTGSRRQIKRSKSDGVDPSSIKVNVAGRSATLAK